MGLLLERNDSRLFPVSLLAKALQKGRDEFYSIDTVNKAGRWSIGLDGAPQLAGIDMQMALQACINNEAWRGDRDSALAVHPQLIRSGKSGGLTHYRFAGYGGEGTEDCFVAIQSPRNEVSVEFVSYMQADDSDALESAASRIKSLSRTQWADPHWYFLPPETKLSELSAFDGSLPPKREKPEEPSSRVPKDLYIVDQRDVTGDALRHFTIDSADDCAVACGSDKSCNAFVFNTWNRICFLKSSIGKFRFEPASRAGYREAVGRPGPMSGKLVIQRYRKRVFPDKPYLSIQLDKEQQCFSACMRRDNCVAYSYEIGARQCHLLPQASEYTKNVAFDSGVKREEE